MSMNPSDKAKRMSENFSHLPVSLLLIHRKHDGDPSYPWHSFVPPKAPADPHEERLHEWTAGGLSFLSFSSLTQSLKTMYLTKIMEGENIKIQKNKECTLFLLAISRFHSITQCLHLKKKGD